MNKAECHDRNHVGLEEVMSGKRLPAPELGQNAAWVAHALGKLEADLAKCREELERCKQAIRDNNPAIIIDSSATKEFIESFRDRIHQLEAEERATNLEREKEYAILTKATKRITALEEGIKKLKRLRQNMPFDSKPMWDAVNGLSDLIGGSK
jgi:glutamine synthetase adenylyltransferase